MSWLKDRLKEMSSYIGLATLLLGAGTIGKVNEAPGIANTISAAAEPLSNGDYTTGLGILIMGILGVFMREKQR